MAKGKVTGKRRGGNNRKNSADFWRFNLLKILECLFYEELTWSRINWRKYGVSKEDQLLIEQEFERWYSTPRGVLKNGKLYNKEGKLVAIEG